MPRYMLLSYVVSSSGVAAVPRGGGGGGGIVWVDVSCLNVVVVVDVADVAGCGENELGRSSCVGALVVAVESGAGGS